MQNIMNQRMRVSMLCGLIILIFASVLHTTETTHAQKSQPKSKRITQIELGAQHSCVLKIDSSIWCWGNNQDKQLSNGSYFYYVLRQTQVRDQRNKPFLNSKFISAGRYHTCAIRKNGTVWCWGHNGSGQLGNRTTTSSSYPVQVIRADGIALSGITHIDAGNDSTCARDNSGYVFCWGDGSSVGAQLINKSDGFPLQALSISMTFDHACAVGVTRSVWCWGENDHGQLGNNTTSSRFQSTATEVQIDSTAILGGATQVTTGVYHSCARRSDGSVWCWGRNYFGELGNQTTEPQYVAVAVMSGAMAVTNAQSIFAGYYHTCMVTTARVVRCWGHNWAGNIGDGTKIARLEPVNVTRSNRTVMSGIASGSGGQDHTCVLSTTAAVWCWGYNYYGQLGDGSQRTRLRGVTIK